MRYIKFKITIIFLLYAINSISAINIEKLLIETENMGTTEPRKFDENLADLQKHSSNFTAFQNDYFDYLLYYKQGYNGQFEESLNNFKALYTRSDFFSIKYRAQVKIANIYVISGNITQALNSLDFVLSNVNKVKNKSLKKLGYRIAQTVYYLVEENKLSESFSNLILDTDPNENEKCVALTNIGQIKLRTELNHQNILEPYINERLKVCELIGDFVFSNLLRMDWLGYRLYQVPESQSNYKYVLDQLESSESQIEKTNYKNLINIKNSLFSQVYWRLKDKENALKYAILTIKDSESIGSTVQKIAALDILVDYYKDIGNLNQAFIYLEEKNSSEKSYNNQQQAKLMAYQKVKHDSLAKVQQINSLNQQNEVLVLRSQLAEKSKRNQLLINILFSIIVIFFILFAFRLIRQQNKFKKLSELDHMTLIYNRKGAKDYMGYLLPYSEKKKETIAYVIFDLDLFKRVNDVYGHVVGDWVIKQSVEVCKNLDNHKATFARLGGKEFSIVIRDSNIDEAIEFSNLCRKAISGINTLDGCNHEFDVSASFGITTSEISGYDYTKLMTHADNALYYSKENGRNRLTIYHQYETKE